MVLWDVFLYFQSSAPFLLHVGKRQKPVGGNRERHEEWRMTAKDGRKSLGRTRWGVFAELTNLANKCRYFFLPPQ